MANITKRTNKILISLTDAEALEVSDSAKKVDVSKAVFCRTASLGQSLPLPFADRKLLAEINRIGNNLNQVARSLNEKNNLNQTMAKAIKDAILITVELRNSLLYINTTEEELAS